MMSPGIRKLMLTVHGTSSVGWLGAIEAYIALNVPVLASDDEQTVRAAYLMMDVVMRYALLPWPWPRSRPGSSRRWGHRGASCGTTG